MGRVATLPAGLSALVLAVGAAAALGDEDLPASLRPQSVPDRVIVEWQPGVTSVDRVAARADADAALVRTLGAPAFQLVRPRPGQTVADAIAALRADPRCGSPSATASARPRRCRTTRC